MHDCLFCKIVRGEIPAQKADETPDILVFHDIHPKAPVHLLLIPKRHIASLLDSTENDQALLGQLLAQVCIVAKKYGLLEGFKTAINTGIAGGQEVAHLHVHVYGTPSSHKES